MTYAIDDAERSSACKMLCAYRGKIATDIWQERNCGVPTSQRLADMERERLQLRNDIVAVRVGDRAVTTRVHVMYGALVRAWHAPTPA